MYEQINYEVTDPVAVITLNRPQQMNAWTARMGDEVSDAMRRATADRRVVGIVLTGEGRGFCSGADLTDLQALGSGGQIGSSAGPDEIDRPGEPSWGDDLRGTYTFPMSIPKPVIAAINGPVAGMGVPIALSCDMRFMARGARIITAFAERGLVAEWGISWILPRLVGSAVALDLLFSSRRVEADEAERLGLVNRAVEPEALLATATGYVEDLAARCSPTSMAIMKRQVYQQLHVGLAAAEAEAHALMKESFTRPELSEGVAAFREKRPPRFSRIGTEANT